MINKPYTDSDKLDDRETVPMENHTMRNRPKTQYPAFVKAHLKTLKEIHRRVGKKTFASSDVANILNPIHKRALLTLASRRGLISRERTRNTRYQKYEYQITNSLIVALEGLEQ